YDMVIGSLLLLVIALAVTGGFGWFDQFGTLFFGVLVFIAIMIISPVLHRGANIIGYILGLKDRPW
ncbi:MAG TPA: CDP-archaeol synthase, partial [Methanocorpusculum sp.]|nr:CDP-archaeol synthase [Methanocorpusculum sp.]